MFPIPTLPTRSEIRRAADAVLAPHGFRRKGSWTYHKQTSSGLILEVSLNGNEAGQSVFLGAVWMTANKAALEAWDEVGRKWLFDKKELYPGVPLARCAFKQGVVRNSTNSNQRMWVFTQIPLADEPVSLDQFCNDLRLIAVDLIDKTPDPQSALQSPQFDYAALWELEATVHATLGDRVGFDRCCDQVLGRIAHFERLAEQREKERGQEGGKALTFGGPALDFEKYFDSIRARFF